MSADNARALRYRADFDRQYKRAEDAESKLSEVMEENVRLASLAGSYKNALVASEARVEELRQALATVCPADPGEGWPDDAWLVIEGRIGGLPTRATVADFRRARSLLSREG